MPSPPKSGESQKDFIGRCVPVVMDEGKPKDQAIAICYSMWRRRNKKSYDDALNKLNEIKSNFKEIESLIQCIDKED